MTKRLGRIRLSAAAAPVTSWFRRDPEVCRWLRDITLAYCRLRTPGSSAGGQFRPPLQHLRQSRCVLPVRHGLARIALQELAKCFGTAGHSRISLGDLVERFLHPAHLDQKTTPSMAIDVDCAARRLAGP